MGSCGRISPIPGTARLVKTASIPSDAEELDGLELVRLPSHDEMLAEPRDYLTGPSGLSARRTSPAASSRSPTATAQSSSCLPPRP